MANRSELFLNDIEVFLKRSGMSASAFGVAVANDPALVHDLRRGRRPNLDLCEKCLKFISRRSRKQVA